MKKLLKILLSFFAFCLFTFAFVAPLNMPSGNWYLQQFPNLNGRAISDITFIDSLNGYAVTRLASTNDTNYILKSTNSGDNWSIVYKQFTSSTAPFYKVKFFNKDTGYVGGNKFLKTTNGGLNWTALNLPVGSFARDIAVLNEDTLWFADLLPFDGGLFRSTDKGISWLRQYDATPAPNPHQVYMYNARLGFMSRTTLIYKTTNSGDNWFTVAGNGGWLDIHFIDSLTGWKANSSNATLIKTTNGGFNWVNQPMPSGGLILSSAIQSIFPLNKDTLFGSGGGVFYGAGRVRGILYRTTNGGDNWLYQISDTSYQIAGYYKVQFLNKNTGWGYGVKNNSDIQLNIHTTNGGDTNFLIGLQQISSEVPHEYNLYQNYPNPFNPATNIEYSVKSETSNLKIIVYDIQGNEVIKLVNQKHSAGTYKVDFFGSGFASGVYFYSLTAGGTLIDTKKMILLK